MGSQQDLLECYEILAPLTGRMVEVARAGDWETLSLLETEFRQTVERLRTIQASDKPSEMQKAHKYRLLRRILADDAEIRHLVAPEMRTLSELIGTTTKRHKLHKTYGSAGR